MSERLTERASGVFTISATPFAEDGTLDLASTDRLMDFYLGHGVHGVTLLGIMGEAPKLTQDESLAFVGRALKRLQGRIPAVIGVSASGLQPLAAFAKRVMDLGAAGVMVAPTPGLKGDRGVYDYYAQVFQLLGPAVPVVLQDYPQANGVHLDVEVFHRLVDAFPQLVMLKHEDAPGLSKLTRIRAESAAAGRRRVSILIGNGGLYYVQELQRGADGAMTGYAYPEMLVEVYRRFVAGDRDVAEDLFDAHLPLLKHEQQPGFGLLVRKEILRRRGAIASAKVRAPGGRLSGGDLAELDRLIQRLEQRLAAAAAFKAVA
jgi:4-hydroxy-tetrahydrodipicolinate synthase